RFLMTEMVVVVARRTALTAIGALLVSLAGCDGGEFSTAPVSGKVVMNGQPVTEGNITFSPIAEGNSELSGKPASGDIGSDGTFTLSTYGENDGAVVGKHRVIFSPPLEPPPATPEGGHAAPMEQSRYARAIPLTSEVEVKSG